MKWNKNNILLKIYQISFIKLNFLEMYLDYYMNFSKCTILFSNIKLFFAGFYARSHLFAQRQSAHKGRL